MAHVRYKLSKTPTAVFFHDLEKKSCKMLVSHPIISIENMYIDGVEYVLGEDGESLLPVPPEGGIFRLCI